MVTMIGKLMVRIDNSNEGPSESVAEDEGPDRRSVTLLEELSRNVLVTYAEGGVCDVYVVGTVHVSEVGQGTYNNVYKAIEGDTGEIVALKKVKFNTSEPESIKFMAREIMMIQRLDHPTVVKLKGLATSRS